MDCFVMGIDERTINPLKINCTNEELNLKKAIVKNVEMNFYTEIVDYCLNRVLFYKYHIFSDNIKEVLATYDETLQFYPIFATNKKYQFQQTYWNMFIDETKDMIKNKCSHINDAVFDIDKLESKPIHSVYLERQQFILVNLYVAESILRRLPVGIRFYRIENIG